MLASLISRSAVLCFTLTTFASVSLAQDQMSELLAPADYASVRAAMVEALHRVEVGCDGFEARNPGPAWQLGFDGRGVLVEPDSEEWTWGLELVRYGFADEEVEVGEAACASSDRNRVAYQWDDVLEEWYINDASGLEHGFTVHERPTHATAAGELRFELAVRGNLTPVLNSDRRGARFVDEQGATGLNYAGLKVFDADGEFLPAWFELANGLLVFVVDERGARYPLTIDPTAQEAFIKASNTGPQDLFGGALSLSGDTLVVGATGEDSSATGIGGAESDDFAAASSSGAVYVFVRAGSSWTQQAYIKASNTGHSDNFGVSVGISGDTLVVGAWLEDSSAVGVNGDDSDDSVMDAGAAYVFVRSGTTWSQQAYLKASNTGADDDFGKAVAVSGDTIVVGAPNEDSSATGTNGSQGDDSVMDAGAAYVFVRSGSVWSQQAYLKSSNTDANDHFGLPVAISDDTVVIGSIEESSNATGVNGNESDNTVFRAGAGYVFVRSGTTWSQEAYLKASNTDAGDRFGGALAISADTIVIGAEGEDSSATGVDGDQGNLVDSLLSRHGAAYVFARTGTTWTQEAYLKASNSDSLDSFGFSVAISGDVLVAGAFDEGSSATCVNGNQSNNLAVGSGAAYLFERNGTTWSQRDYIKATRLGSTALNGSQHFGIAVAVSGDSLAVSSPNEPSDVTGVNSFVTGGVAVKSGAVFAFGIEAGLPVLSPTGVDFCNGDSGNGAGCTNCPCMNNAVMGTVGGCLNSSGGSARLSAAGDTSASLLPCLLTDLRFSLTGVPAHSFCILNSGDGVAPNNPMNMCFGMGSGVPALQFDGLRCAVANTRRHGGRSADANGEIGLGSGSNPWGGEGGPNAGIATAGGGFVSGQTRYFQVIHRDDPLAVCMRGLNTSQAVEIVFGP